MPQTVEAMNQGAQNRASELESVFASGQGRKLMLCQGELEGIRAILANPEPPTEELKAAWAEYDSFVSTTPEPNR